MTSEERKIKLVNGVELPPFRTMDDFLLSKNRFDLPPYNDLPKWNNRIIANLLYYQTNYFAAVTLCILISTFFSAQELVIGFTAIAAIGAVIIFASSSNPQIYQVRRDHPFITLGAIAIACYYFITVLPSVLVVVFSLLFPIFLVLLHASVRLRDFMSKVNQTAEKMGLRTTVMGRLLDLCGVSVRA